MVLQESERLISTVLSVQPRMSHAAGAVSNDDMVASMAQETLANLPALLAREDASIAKDPFAPLPTGGLALLLPTTVFVGMRKEAKRSPEKGKFALEEPSAHDEVQSIILVVVIVVGLKSGSQDCSGSRSLCGAALMKFVIMTKSSASSEQFMKCGCGRQMRCMLLP